MSLPERRNRSIEADKFLIDLYAAIGKPNGIALVAVGGYGRGELSPGSDLDLLILHDNSLENLLEVSNSFLYPIWDKQGPDSLPREVDYSVRTIKETKEALADLKVVLGLLDARFLCGNEDLFQSLLDRKSVV